MSTRCAYVMPYPWHEQCGRFVAPADVAHGRTLCAVHDPDHKARTLARNAERRARHPDVVARASLAGHARSRLIAEIQELAYLWDGPGSEGRCV